jgi:hypothetical protein
MCNCKKKKEEPVVPQTPEEQHSFEITEWAGGMNIEIKVPNQEEMKEE